MSKQILQDLNQMSHFQSNTLHLNTSIPKEHHFPKSLEERNTNVVCLTHNWLSPEGALGHEDTISTRCLQQQWGPDAAPAVTHSQAACQGCLLPMFVFRPFHNHVYITNLGCHFSESIFKSSGAWHQLIIPSELDARLTLLKANTSYSGLPASTPKSIYLGNNEHKLGWLGY